jgi:hypothetical protein
LYIGDLPNELLTTFAAQHLYEQGKQHGTEGEKYLAMISTAMQSHKEYKAKMRHVMEAIRQYKQSAGILNGKDPKQ